MYKERNQRSGRSGYSNKTHGFRTPRTKPAVHDQADLTEYQLQILDYLETYHEGLKETLANGVYTELTEIERRMISVYGENNPFVVLGVCSKYKLAKKLRGIKPLLEGLKPFTWSEVL